MRTYAKSCVRRKSFYSKSELQMLMLSLIMISGGHICVSKLYTNMASPYKVYNGAWNVSANNSETVGHIDLRLVKLFIYQSFATLLFLGFFHWTVFNLFFLYRIYWVTVKRDRFKGLCNLVPRVFLLSNMESDKTLGTRLAPLLSGYRCKEKTTRRAGIGRGEIISVSISFSPCSLVRASSHYIRFELHVYLNYRYSSWTVNRAVDIPPK